MFKGSYLRLVRAHTIPREGFGHRGDGVAGRPLIPQSIQNGESQLIRRRDVGRGDERLDRLQIRRVSPAAAREALLDLARVQQPIPPDDPAELAHQRDVLAHVPAELPELGVLLHEPLHVRDGLDGRRRLRERLGLVVGDQLLHRGAEVAEVVVEVLREEGVGLGEEGNLLMAVPLSVDILIRDGL